MQWGIPSGVEDLPKEIREEIAMEAVNPGTLMKMSTDDGEQWIYAIRAELPSFADLEVFDQVMPEQ
eukprot:1093347-Prorocentrum_lima.AAC.1